GIRVAAARVLRVAQTGSRSAGDDWSARGRAVHTLPRRRGRRFGGRTRLPPRAPAQLAVSVEYARASAAPHLPVRLAQRFGGDSERRLAIRTAREQHRRSRAIEPRRIL